MFRSASARIAIGAVFVLVALGLLRYQPWKRTSANTPGARQTVTVAFLPVTCHLTCPVTDYSSKTSVTGTRFDSQRFTSFPPVADAMKAKQIEAAFMIVPLAMKLSEQGVPIKICYLGHRDGSTVIVPKDSTAKSLRDLKGKTMAIPSFYSNQYLVIRKMMADQGLQPNDISFLVLPPPDMPRALGAGKIDSYFVGEPHAAKAEMDGTGRVLYLAKDIWPNFISCALVVHEDLIKNHPDEVQDLVRGIADSGEWAETHRAEAAHLVAPYYKQNEKLLNFVLTQPGRVSYRNLTPTDQDLQQIEDMALKTGIMKKPVPMSELIDRDFIPKTIVPADIHVQMAAK